MNTTNIDITGQLSTPFIKAAAALARLHGADVERAATGLLLAHRDAASRDALHRGLSVLAAENGITIDVRGTHPHPPKGTSGAETLSGALGSRDESRTARE